LARPESERVTAVEEASPPRMPVKPSPRRGPAIRTATYPVKLMPAMSTTIRPILKGFRTSSGPMVRLGNWGSTTSATSRNFRVA